MNQNFPARTTTERHRDVIAAEDAKLNHDELGIKGSEVIS